MDISLLLEPQAKHRRMYRGDSMYDEHSVAEIKTMPCQYCNCQFAPKAYVHHIRKPKCLKTEKNSLYDLSRRHLFSYQRPSNDEKRSTTIGTEINSESRLKSSITRRDNEKKVSKKWRENSNKIRAAINLLQEAKRAKVQRSK